MCSNTSQALLHFTAMIPSVVSLEDGAESPEHTQMLTSTDGCIHFSMSSRFKNIFEKIYALGTMMPTLNPYTLKAEASVSLRLAWSVLSSMRPRLKVRLSKDKNTTKPLKNLFTTFTCSVYFHVHNKHAGIHGDQRQKLDPLGLESPCRCWEPKLGPL